MHAHTDHLRTRALPHNTLYLPSAFKVAKKVMAPAKGRDLLSRQLQASLVLVLAWIVHSLHGATNPTHEGVCSGTTILVQGSMVQGLAGAIGHKRAEVCRSRVQATACKCV